ncbi:2-oxo-4-hydroxy-4-carboxy-5-ureidoimidazoline decarboxylase [Streptantibioticus silvisoli]|uniref:2-oxo-4-hydroxy-4-carboxy-5-ureidoimidazoline decarboxylase n=1 Tax=Streptantibioticus silvisoli TaxID=2705255 RepID=UPI003556C5EF
MASDLPAVPHVPRTTASAPLPPQNRGGTGIAALSGASGLVRLNSLSPVDAEAEFLECCGSHRWARLMTSHRPYPDPGALLAAAYEAAYDLDPSDLAEALAAESAEPLPPGGGQAAQTALSAAHAEYERRFGHAFVISVAGVVRDEQVDHILAGIHARLGNREEAERTIAEDELRALALARLATRLVTPPPSAATPPAANPAS